MGCRGRPKSSNRLRKEDCAALTISMLQLPSRWNALTSVIPVEGVIGGDRPFRIRLRVTRTQRGWRFLCPRCGRRSAVVYFPPDAVEPACRVCLRLVYECQYDKLPAWAQAMRYQFGAGAVGA
jgi:hypothetical protein